MSGERNEKKAKIKVLFDSGSMKTYMSERLVNLLNLKPTDKQETYVNSFGSSSGKLMETYIYNLCLRGSNNSCYYIKGNLCSTLRWICDSNSKK